MSVVGCYSTSQNHNSKEHSYTKQVDSQYSVPVTWARTRNDLDCRWAALRAHSEGPISLVSLGMTA